MSARLPRARARAGSSTRRHGARLALQGLALTTAGLLLAGLALSTLTGRARTITTIAAAMVALAGWARANRSRRWMLGAGGERDVARRLARLDRGWLVVHDIPKSYGGNLDHLVAGPRGVYVIETKLARYGPRELAQARAHAAWAQRSLGVNATAVLCVARSRQRPRLHAGVWCIGAPRLTRFLRRQHGTPVDIQQLAERLSRLPGA